jgi:hypothetical protein
MSPFIKAIHGTKTESEEDSPHPRLIDKRG